MSIDPSLTVQEEGFVVLTTVNCICVGEVRVTLPLTEQPFTSVATTEYTPAAKPETVEVVAFVLHTYVQFEFPPAVMNCADPFADPKQVGSVAVSVAVSTGGLIRLMEFEFVQPAASVIVYVYVPAVNPLMEGVVAVVDHK
jgi:hypothetical protein